MVQYFRRLFAEIFNMNARGLYQLETMQPHTRWEVGLQLVPNGGHEVLDGADATLHEFDIQVEVAVVQVVDYMLMNQPAELLGVEYETRLGVGMPFDRDMQLKVVAMPMLVRAASEDLLIALPRPCRIVELVGCVEMFDPCQVDHLRRALSAGARNYGLIHEMKINVPARKAWGMPKFAP